MRLYRFIRLVGVASLCLGGLAGCGGEIPTESSDPTAAVGVQVEGSHAQPVADGQKPQQGLDGIITQGTPPFDPTR